MAQILNARPSGLLNIEDEYCAWCLDEAVTTIIASLRRKRRLRPKQTANNNRALIEKMMGESNRPN